MREYIITTESNNDMPADFLSENGIIVIPHYYSVEDEVYGGDKQISIHEFYDDMRAKKKVGTMASNPAVIRDTFTKAAEEGKDVLHISFSSGLSGGYNNVVMGAKEVMEEHPEMTIKVVDTLSVTLGEGVLLKAAVDARKQGKNIEEAAAFVEAMVPHMVVLFTVEDLNYLYRGGRLKKSTTVVGTIANIKPILHVDDEGKLVSLANTRGRKKSINMLIQYMKERIGSYRDKQYQVAVAHGDCEEDAQYLANLVTQEFGYKDILIGQIGASIGAHSGPGTVGVIFLGDKK